MAPTTQPILGRVYSVADIERAGFQSLVAPPERHTRGITVDDFEFLGTKNPISLFTKHVQGEVRTTDSISKRVVAIIDTSSDEGRIARLHYISGLLSSKQAIEAYESLVRSA